MFQVVVVAVVCSAASVFMFVLLSNYLMRYNENRFNK